jgi:queuine tRNA-ribosyltransferase/7-cyano-7-deazaguanine tRNA-ribosyltransferase
MFEFKILKKEAKSKARVAEFQTPHGKLLTPELAFVATEGELKSIPNQKYGQNNVLSLQELPVRLIIVNTFHIFTKQILEKIEKVGGIHNFTNFPRVIQSDSGGFQAFSLGFGIVHKVGKVANIFPGETNHGLTSEVKLGCVDDLNPLKITEDGVEFSFNNDKILLTPEKSIRIQQKIGADIIFAFDECTSPLNTKDYTKRAMERTHRWLKRCIEEYQISKIKNQSDVTGVEKKGPPQRAARHVDWSSEHWGEMNSRQALSQKQALFGIIQGGYFEDLRKQSAKFLAKQDIAGFGIGGSLGKTKQDVWSVLGWTIPYLPEEKPRHLLGIGQVRDIFESVERGVDLFDCVIPTREARHKVIYTNYGRLNLRKIRNINEVIDKKCKCTTCSNNLTIQQLYQLFLLKDPLAFYYLTVHNIQFFSDLMKHIREAIELNRFFNLKKKFLNYY